MSVNINTVYQRVQSIANKEQRGYITPLEFNRFANQSQLEIFEQYFYDLNQFVRIGGNDTRHADMVTGIEEKIALFEVFNSNLGDYNSATDCYDLPSALHKLSTVSYIKDGGVNYQYYECENVTKKNLKLILTSNLTLPTTTRPIYTRQGSEINVYTGKTTSPYFTELQTNDLIEIDYIKQPTEVTWGYVLDSNNDALYNSAASTNFELHPSEEPNLVIKILELAGIAMKSPDVYQVADKENIEDIQQQKQ